jgi:hypothetical protein
MAQRGEESKAERGEKKMVNTSLRAGLKASCDLIFRVQASFLREFNDNSMTMLI